MLSRMPRHRDHGLGQRRDASDSCEADSAEAGFLEQCGQGGHRPELDMAVIPQSGEVSVHFAGERHRQVFPIAVIRRRQQSRTPLHVSN